MSETSTAPAVGHRRGRTTLLAVLVAIVALVPMGCSSQASSPSDAPPPGTGVPRVANARGDGGLPGELDRPPRRDQQGTLDIADGEVPDGVTVFDDHYPAVTNLDPRLLSALRAAATAAAADGVRFYVDSGWRSRSYQEQLFRDAVAKYGSEEQAARWVARPGTSAHEAGQAVDLGPSDATTWLSQHGAGYGLCQIYGNEPWHYELRPAAITHGCPATYADPTHDPRMLQ